MSDDLNLDAGLESAAERVRRIARGDKLPDDLTDDFLKIAVGIESGGAHYDRRGRVKLSPPDPKTGARAVGFSQIKPETAKSVGVADPFDEEQNILAGLRYFNKGGADPIRRRIAYFSGQDSRAVKHYDRTGRIPSGGDFTGTSFHKYITATGGQKLKQPDVDLSAGFEDDPLNLDDGLESAEQPRGRFNAMAQANPMQPRRRPSVGQVEASGIGAPPVSIADLRPRDDDAIAAKQQQENQIRQQVRRERLSDAPTPARLFGKVFRSVGAGGDPVTAYQELTETENDLVAKEVAERLRVAERTSQPNVQFGRREMGALSAAGRVVAAPQLRAQSGLLKKLGGVTSVLGIAPNQVSDYLNAKGQLLEDVSTQPLDAKGEAIQQGIPEKAATALGDLGVGVAQIIGLKSATGLSIANIMAIETALQTSDMPTDKRAVEVGKAYAMGRTLDGHLSRKAGAAVFGIPTVAQEAPAVASGQQTPEDAVLNTLVQAGSGFVLSGKRGQGRESIQNQRTAPVSERAPEVNPEVPQVNRAVDPRTGEPVAIKPAAIEAVAPEVKPSEPSRNLPAQTSVDIPVSRGALATQPASAEVRHVDLQSRRVRGEGKGQFKKESTSQKEERRAQVNPPEPTERPIQPLSEPLRESASVSPTAEGAAKATPSPAPYIGNLKQGIVDGFADPKRAAEHTNESLIGGERWRYEPSNGTVYWTTENPSMESKFAVENWLDRRGQSVQSHDRISNYDPVTIRKREAASSESIAPREAPFPAREPWQMTRDQFRRTSRYYDELTKRKQSGEKGVFQTLDARRDVAIKDAIAEGKPVPPEAVLTPKTTEGISTTETKAPPKVLETKPVEVEPLRPSVEARLAQGQSLVEESGLTLARAVRRAGGIRYDKDAMNKGELKGFTLREGRNFINNKSGRTLEQMADDMAVEGYGIGDWANPDPGRGFKLDRWRFLEALEEDASGRMKHFSTRYQPDPLERPEYKAWVAEEQGRHDKDVMITLLENEQSGLIFDRIRSGKTNESEVQRFRELTAKEGGSPELAEDLIASAREAGSKRSTRLSQEEAAAEVDFNPTALEATPTKAATPKLQQFADQAAAIRQKLSSELTKVERTAIERKATRLEAKARGEEVRRSGADPYELIDDIIIRGGELIREGKTAFDEWSRKMRAEFGRDADPHLRRVWKSLRDESQLPEATSVKNEATAELRADLGLLEMERPERKTWETTINNALAKGLDKKAESIAEDVISGKNVEGLTDEQSAGIQRRMRELENQWEEVYTKNPADAKLADIEKRLDNLTKAEDMGGTAPARALSFRRSAQNKEFKLINLIQQAKKAYGRELTPKERTRYEEIVKERDKAVKERDTALEKLHTKRLQDQLDRAARVRAREGSKKALDEEAAVIKQNIAAEFARLKSQMSSIHSQGGLGSLDPEGVITRNLLRYARNRARANVGLKAEALIDDAHGLVSDFGVTRRQVAEVLSGYGHQVVDRRSEAAKRLAEIRAEIASLLSTADVASGVRTERTQGPRPSDVRKLPAEGPRLSDARGRKEGPQLGSRQGPQKSEARKLPAEGPRQSEARSSGIPLQGPRLSEGVGKPEGPQLGERQGPRLREGVGPKEGPSLGLKQGPENVIKRNQRRLDQLLKQEREWERKFNERDFEHRRKPEPYPYNSDVRRAEDRVRIAEAKFKREMERARPGHQIRNLSGVMKSWLLSGPPTQAMNIVGTGSYQVFREVARMPAAIGDAVWSQTGARAFSNKGQRSISGPSPSAMLDSVIQSGKVGGREFLEIMKHGATREQMERHQYQEIDFGVNTGKKGIDNGVKIIELAHNGIFRFMSGSDRVFYQGAYKRSLIDRARVQALNEGVSDVKARTKELVDNPSERLEADAKHDALVSTFNNNNWLSTKIKRARAAVINPESLMTEKSAQRLNALENVAMDFVLPFDRTPTNVVTRIVEASPLGYGKNVGQLVSAAMRGSMSVEHQRQMMQTFGNATTGTALMALGWYLGDEAKGIIVVDGYDVFLKIPGLPKINLRTASPAGNLLAIGARERAVHQDKDSTWGDYAKPVLREAGNIPILRAGSPLTETIRDPERSGPKTAARFASMAVPFGGAVRWAGQLIDPADKRYPDTSFKEQFQKGIPKWRESLPASRARLLGSKQTKAVTEVERLGMSIQGVVRQPDESQKDFAKRRDFVNPYIRRAFEKVVAMPDYEKDSDENKLERLKQAKEAAQREGQTAYEAIPRPQRFIKPKKVYTVPSGKASLSPWLPPRNPFKAGSEAFRA